MRSPSNLLARSSWRRFFGPARLGAGAPRIAIVAGALAFAGVALAPPASAQEPLKDDPAFLTIQGGQGDIFHEDETLAFGVEYRSDYKLWIFKPFAGVTAGADGFFNGYGGILLDMYFGRRVVLTMSFAPGGYVNGDKDLGNTLEFRSAGEIAYRFDNRARLGLMINHISNASLGDRNPGTEILMLSYSYPLNGLFGN